MNPSLDNPKTLADPSLRLAVLCSAYSVEFVAAYLKSEIKEWDCYELSLNNPKYFFDYMEATILEKVQSLIRQYTETGFREVWLKWDMFRFALAGFKNVREEYVEHISFTNLSSFFIIYGILLSVGGLGFLAEIRVDVILFRCLLHSWSQIKRKCSKVLSYFAKLKRRTFVGDFFSKAFSNEN